LDPGFRARVRADNRERLADDRGGSSSFAEKSPADLLAALARRFRPVNPIRAFSCTRVSLIDSLGKGSGEREGRGMIENTDKSNASRSSALTGAEGAVQFTCL